MGKVKYLAQGRNMESGRTVRRWFDSVDDAREAAEKLGDGSLFECREIEGKRVEADSANADKGREAVAKYLKLKGYKVVDELGDGMRGGFDIVAKDGDEYVFVDVFTRADDGNAFDGIEPPKSMAEFEHAALKIAAERELECKSLRYDFVAVLVVADDRALVKHFVNYQWR